MRSPPGPPYGGCRRGSGGCLAVVAKSRYRARRETADPQASPVRLRPLERSDLHFVHQLNNNRNVMGYWFEEPYESFVELEELFRKHIHDQSERRFIIERGDGVRVGLVELVEINHLHRRAEFLVM